MWVNGEEWGLLLMCEVFILLAIGASFNVLSNPLVHPWPPVGGGDLSNGFVPPWVTCDWSTVVVAEDIPLYLFIWGNDYLSLGLP